MEKLKDITVLITAAGNMFMPGTSQCLRNNGERNIRLIGADMSDDPTMLQMFDTYYSVPRGDDVAYIDTVFDICIKENVDVVLPIMSVELEAFAENKEKFEEAGIKVSVSDLPALKIANNKLELLSYMKQKGIPCAEFSSANTVEEVKNAALSMGYPKKPVCIKATQGSGSRGFRILDASKSKFDMLFHQKPTSCYTSLEELLEILAEGEELPELMVMEYLPGAEYTVDLLADKGKVLYNCCRKSLSMENSIMIDGVIESKKSVLDICEKVVKELKLDGNIGFDIRERTDGTPIIMECNPRITAGIPFFFAAGVNLPYLCVKKNLGEELPELSIKEYMKMKRRYLEMYY